MTLLITYTPQALHKMLLLFSIPCILLSHTGLSQNVPAPHFAADTQFNGKELQALTADYASVSKHLHRKNEKTLRNMQRGILTLEKGLQRRDTLAAQRVRTYWDKQYTLLRNRMLHADTVSGPVLPSYLPNVDTTRMAIQFIEKNTRYAASLSSKQLQQIATAGSSVKDVQLQLTKADYIQQFFKSQQQFVTQQVPAASPLAGQLQAINKEYYYYQVRLQEYKTLLNDKTKLQQKALDQLRRLPGFTDFTKKNSFLAKLFPANAPDNSSNLLPGLQSRTLVGQQLTERFGINNSGPSATQGSPLQPQMQDAQGQLNQLKGRFSQSSNGGSDQAIPVGFTPNHQKTKSFLQRLEYGVNLQSQRSSSLLPSVADIGVSAGYKLSDKSTIGIGASYKLGWGKPFKDIQLTGEGVGVRSFLNVRAKGNFWITGGYELNYLQRFGKMADLPNVEQWSKSGLIGLTKTYKLGKKKGNLQLMWDFLSYYQQPRTKALLFRTGYIF